MAVKYILILLGTVVSLSHQTINFHCLIADKICPNPYVKFYLYTRATQQNPTIVDITQPNLSQKFLLGRQLIFLIHGFTGHKDFAPNPEIRPAYFENGEYNIISLDYQPLAIDGCYFTAVDNLKVVANCTAQLIDQLVTDSIFTFDQIHVIGFSLGGQLAGMIATYLTSGKLKRITGLEPAKPLFITAPRKYRIDPSDADFVQIIHTDVFARGMLRPCGHVDFYVNGGYKQTGCANLNLNTAGECNHNRAPEYFAESINSNIGFWGYQCPHWYLYVLGLCKRTGHQTEAIMGDPTPYDTRGLFFLRTNKDPPRAQGRQQSDDNLNHLDNNLIEED